MEFVGALHKTLKGSCWVFVLVALFLKQISLTV